MAEELLKLKAAFSLSQNVEMVTSYADNSANFKWEQATAGTYTVNLPFSGIYHVEVVGGGGGGLAKRYRYSNDTKTEVNAGASGAAFSGEMFCPAGSYKIVVGNMGNGGAGGNSTFANITCTGGGLAGAVGKCTVAQSTSTKVQGSYYAQNGKGGGTYRWQGHVYSEDPGANRAGGATVSKRSNYGAGGSINIGKGSARKNNTTLTSKGIAGFVHISSLREVLTPKKVSCNTAKCLKLKDNKFYVIKD